jgi:predicted AlkP superfamily phosphohydrolase/phosphomutase
MSPVFNTNYICGFRPKNTNEIWISKQAIESFNITTCMIAIDVRNLLIRVILDELAHVKTNKDHGNKEYDNKLEEYYEKINSRYKSMFGI